MIFSGLITQRANDERLPALTVERDYVLAHLCAEIGSLGDSRLVFKGGTLLRLCYFENYRYSADLDFSAVDGLTVDAARALVETAIGACRSRVELPMLDVAIRDGSWSWVTYVGPLGARPRKLKLDISDDELVTSQARVALQRRWPDLPEDSAINGYTLDEVCAEKVRCLAERLQCRDLFDMHELLSSGHVDALTAWHLYVRKAENDEARGRQRTLPREWAATYQRRLPAYRDRWDRELRDYLPGDVPKFDDVERRTNRFLAPLIKSAQQLAEYRPTDES